MVAWPCRQTSFPPPSHPPSLLLKWKCSVILDSTITHNSAVSCWRPGSGAGWHLELLHTGKFLGVGCLVGCCFLFFFFYLGGITKESCVVTNNVLRLILSLKIPEAPMKDTLLMWSQHPLLLLSFHTNFGKPQEPSAMSAWDSLLCESSLSPHWAERGNSWGLQFSKQNWAFLFAVCYHTKQDGIWPGLL